MDMNGENAWGLEEEYIHNVQNDEWNDENILQYVQKRDKIEEKIGKYGIDRLK